MTAQSLITAVIVGLVIGTAGRMLLGRGRFVPLWLPVSAGVGSALLATVILRMAASGTGPTAGEIVLQVVFAGTGVTVVARTADRLPSPGGNRHGVVIQPPRDRHAGER